MKDERQLPQTHSSAEQPSFFGVPPVLRFWSHVGGDSGASCSAPGWDFSWLTSSWTRTGSGGCSARPRSCFS